MGRSRHIGLHGSMGICARGNVDHGLFGHPALGACSAVAQTRTCTSGTLSGSYASPVCLSGCTGTPWGDVISGYSNTAYQVASGATCPSETRTCTNGTLSGTYTYASCEACAGSPTAGTVCADGSVYAGLSPDGNVKMFTTRCDAGQTWSGSACTGTASTPAWDSSNVDVTAVTNCTSAGSCNAYGKANSAVIVAQRLFSAAAAYYCENLTENGKSDWYLPSLPELNVMYGNKTAIGSFDTSGTYYWSSSEYGTVNAWIERFSDSYQASYGKANYDIRLRCARR